MIILVHEKNDLYSYSTVANINEELTNNPMNPIIETYMADENDDDKNEMFVGKI